MPSLRDVLKQQLMRELERGNPDPAAVFVRRLNDAFNDMNQLVADRQLSGAPATLLPQSFDVRIEEESC